MRQYLFREIENSASLKDFAYKGKIGSPTGLNEDDVKDAIKSALERMSYDVRVSWGQKHGIDIEATLGGGRLVIEAAGEGSSRQHLGNNYLRVIAEILHRMSQDNFSYGVALPAHASYIELVLKLPHRVRQALTLDFYFVRRSSEGYEIGVLRYLTP